MSAEVAFSIDEVDELSQVRPEWEELADTVGTPFATWSWADAWWRQWGRPGALAVRTCRHRDGSVAAILPLCRDGRGPLRALRWIGHGPGDELGPVCRSADRVLAAQALVQALGAEGGVMLAERLPEDEGWDALLDGVVLRREPSPVLALNGDWEDYLASRSANFRQTLRRRERRLARESGLRFRLAESPAQLARDLDILFALHAARFGSRSSILGVRTRAFHHDLAARALAEGWLRLWILELDGRPAAAWYGFRTSRREWYYQAGWDPARARDGIGLLLLAHSVRAAMQDGMTEYRFLRGGEPFKARFGPREGGLVTVGLATGAAGRALLAGARAILGVAPDSATGRIARRVADRAGWAGAT
jgi:CelD/BcsL family acetyltransferase involved in cellulose biosynthesis